MRHLIIAGALTFAVMGVETVVAPPTAEAQPTVTKRVCTMRPGKPTTVRTRTCNGNRCRVVVRTRPGPMRQVCTVTRVRR